MIMRQTFDVAQMMNSITGGIIHVPCVLFCFICISSIFNILKKKFIGVSTVLFLQVMYFQARFSCIFMYLAIK